MKLYLKIFSLLLSNSLFSQNLKILEKYSFKASKFYLCYRGTQAKRNLIAGDFNLSGSPATHIGIGLKVEGKDIIYNVSNDKSINNSSLIIDTLNSFYPSNSDLYYVGIYSREISTKQKYKLIESLKKIYKRKIVFDRNFIISNNDTLYCSEFVVKILSNLFQTNYRPLKKFLKTYLYKTYFNSNFLYYYPVDYFITNKEFKKEIDFLLKK